MKKLYNSRNSISKSEADISLKLWNQKIADYNNNSTIKSSSVLKNENEVVVAPLFDANAPNRDYSEAQFCMNDYYKISASRRNKRTMYSQTYIDNFASDSFYDKFKNTKSDMLLDKSLKETRIKSWFDDPCYHFNTSDRLNQLLKSKNIKHSVEDRFRIYHRSNECKLQKSNNNSSINAIENLARKNSALIQDFKKKFG